MPLPRTTLACAGLLVLGACQLPIFEQDVHSPRVPMRDTAAERIAAGPRKMDVWGPNQRDPGDPAIAAFADALLAVQPRPSSVASLPWVSYDLHHDGPWVSELGVDLADRIASSLRSKGYAGHALGSAEVGLRLAQGNLGRATLSTFESVSANGERLGTDVIVFGTIRRRNKVGAQDRDLLVCDLQAYDVAGRRILASQRWDVPSDDPAHRRVWDLAQAESPWMPDSRWGVPAATPTLAAELRRASGDLAAALLKPIDPARIQGAVYVAPLDTAAFVRSLARLRAAQSAYAGEIARRQGAGAAEMAAPVVLGGTQFPNLQTAEAYLTTLAESLLVTDAARFNQTVAGFFAEELGSRLRPHGTALKDLGATRQSDRALIAGELAQGGLARSLAAREALKAEGIGLVVAPRLERVGDAFQLRADAYELNGGSLSSSATAPIPAGLVPELKRALGSEDLEPVGDVQVTSGRWDALYRSARSGVVHVEGSQGRGSGFVVRPDGHVLTNHHVVRAAGSPLTVTFEGRAPIAAQVVSEDPYWDLALLKVASVPERTHVFTFADAANVGSEVAVLGHPRDSSGWVLTPGHVSSTTEQVSVADGRSRPAVMYTCPTRQGSSGSPVLLADGRVAAVHSAGRVGQSLSGADAVTELTGFALGVPAAAARAFVDPAVRP